MISMQQITTLTERIVQAETVFAAACREQADLDEASGAMVICRRMRDDLLARLGKKP